MTDVSLLQGNFFRGFSRGAFQQGPFGENSLPGRTSETPASSRTQGVPFSQQPSTLAQLSAQRYSLQARIDQSRSLDLQLVTQDGDVVSIALDFQRSAEINRSFEQTSLAGVSGRAAFLAEQSRLDQSFEFSSLSELDIAVDGELDEGELQALQELFSDLDRLAEVFFSGRSNEAQSLALGVQLDASEFASLDLDLNRQRRIDVIETYEAVQTISENGGPQSPSIANSGQSILDLLGQAEQRIEMFAERELVFTEESRIDLLSLFLTRLESLLNPEDASPAEETSQASEAETEEVDTNSSNNAALAENSIDDSRSDLPELLDS